MSGLSVSNLKQWIKRGEHPLAAILLKLAKCVLSFEMPAPKPFSTVLYQGFCLLRDSLSNLLRIFWWTPLFKGRLASCGKSVLLYGGLPYISGPIQIHVRDQARISGQTTFSGRTCSATPPVLEIGSNTDVGWMTTIAVGSRVSIGDNARIAGRALLAGYPGHPLDPADRAAGLPEHDDQVGDIILEPDVWLATGVSVMAGVTIGRGTIVAAGSVVTKDLPPMVLAGGSPARVIRSLEVAEVGQGDSGRLAAEMSSVGNESTANDVYQENSIPESQMNTNTGKENRE